MRLFETLGEIPTKLQVQVGVLVANIADKKLFTKTPSGDIIEFLGSKKFGAKSTHGVLDWNDISNTKDGFGPTLLMGNAANGFGVKKYYNVMNLEFARADGTGNVTQIAIPYDTKVKVPSVYLRTRYVGVWSPWYKLQGAVI